MTDHVFSEFITTRRRDLELSLGDVARTLEVSPISVSNWSNGYSVPDRETLVRLAQLLQSDPDELEAMAAEARETIEPEAMEEQELEAPEAGAEPIEEEIVDLPAAVAPPAPATPADDSVARQVQLAPPEVVVPLDEATEEHWVTTESPVVESPVAGADGQTAARVVEPPPIPAQDDFFDLDSPLAEPEYEGSVVSGGSFAPTYVEDTQLLWRYRIRWAITAVILIIMVFVLFWSVGNMWDTLKSGIDSVLPD